MTRSNISLLVSMLCLLVTAGSIVTFFSFRTGPSGGSFQLRATSLGDQPGGDPTPLSIDPALIGFRQTAQILVDFESPSGLAVDADDKIYVVGDMSLCRYSRKGALEKQVSLSYEPTCVAAASRHHLVPGRVYVGFGDHVEVYQAGGAKQAIWQGLGDRARIVAMATSDSYLFLADAGQNVVQRFDTSGKLLEPFGESSPGHFAPDPRGDGSHFGLTVGLDDLLYVVNRRENRVEGYSFLGEIERRWGQASPALEDFAGHCNPTHLAILGEGHFVTVEQNPLRVKVYNRAGEFQSVVCGPGQVGKLVDMATDCSGRILILDGKDRCVRVFEPKIPAAPKKSGE